MTSLTQRYQLFKTVADLHSQGRVKLSSDEQALLERETMDLVRKSVLNRTAEMAPPGFDKILRSLETAPDANAAYAILVDFLKDAGELGGGKPGLGGEPKPPMGGEPKPPMGEKPGLGGEPKPPMGGGPMGEKPGLGEGPKPPMGGGPKPPMGEKPGLGGEPKPPMGEKPAPKMDAPGSEIGGEGPGEGMKHEKSEPPSVEKSEHEMPPKPESAPAPKPEGAEKPEGKEVPKKEDKDDKGEKKPEGGEKKEEPKKDEAKEKRDALKRRAQELAAEKSKLEELQEKKENFGQEISAGEMGIKPGEGAPMSTMTHEDPTKLRSALRAKKARVHITKSGTIVASHEDFGPIFHAVPSVEIRKDAEKLRLLANRVYGKVVYEGFVKAAKFCNAKLIRSAGVDDGIELNHVEGVEPKTDGITEGAESVNRQKPEGESDSVTKDPEVVTREKPGIEQPDVLAARRRAVMKRARLAAERRRGKDILDEAENVTKDHKPSKPSFNTGDDAETNATEQHGKPKDGVLEGGDDVIRNAQKHFSKLYAARMEKKVAEAKEDFVRRFTRALRLAATRMLLNHEEHPFKAAAVDVLADDSGSIEFSDGHRYSGMDVAAAVELTELIASEGHKDFLDALLTKAADLMQKDDRYLADAESDLAKMAPVSVMAGVSVSKKGSFRSRASSKRREAVEGNFEVNNGAPATGPEISKTADLRDALGGSTLLGRRLGRLGRG